MSYVVLVVIEGCMDTNDEVRRRRLARLCGPNPLGLTAVAEKAGLSRASLDQILKRVLLPAREGGERSPRSLGDLAARKIEAAHQLEPGWLDWPLDAVDYSSYSALSDMDKGAVQARMMAAIEQCSMQSHTPVETPVGQGTKTVQDEFAAKNNKKVLLISSQTESKPSKGANLGTFGEMARTEPKESNAGHKTSRVRKQGNDRNA